LENARLSFQAALAQDYFQLRELDAQKQLLSATVTAFEKSLELTKDLFAQGVDSDVDIQQAETQLKATEAQPHQCRRPSARSSSMRSRC